MAFFDLFLLQWDGPDSRPIANNILESAGGNKWLVRAYAWTLVLFAGVAVMTVGRYAVSWGSRTYNSLYVLAVIVVTSFVVGIVLAKVGRATWHNHHDQVAPAMVVSIIAVTLAIPLGAALHFGMILPGPSYCTRYVETTGNTVPTNQLTTADCVERASRPLNAARITNCAYYVTETSPNTYQALPALCQPGQQPAARPLPQ